MQPPLQVMPFPVSQPLRAFCELPAGQLRIVVGHRLLRGEDPVEILVLLHPFLALDRLRELRLDLIEGPAFEIDHLLEPGGRDHGTDCQAGSRHGDDSHGQQGRDPRPPSDPLDQAAGDRRGPGADRQVDEPALQVLGQILRRGITPGWGFLQAFQGDRLEVAVDPRVDRPGPRRLLLPDQAERFEHRPGAKGRTAGQQFVEDHAQGVDVDGRGDRPRGSPRPAREPCSRASPRSSRIGSSRWRAGRRPAWPGRSR